MGATTRPSEPPAPATAPGRPDGLPPSLLRFDRVERAVHWVNAALFGVLIVTGAALYLQPVGQLVGRRALVENIHVYCGVALPAPVLLAVAGRWGRGLRADLRRFNRWGAADRAWLRALTQPGPVRRRQLAAVRLGKFNAGQKLNAAFIAGAGLVMLGTGVIMRWYHPYPLSWRTGATFVHDWLALGVGLVVIGHIGIALREADAMRSMVTGSVNRGWAKRHAPAWVAGQDGPLPPPGPRASR
jgi:formate dehydrogenase subunit gamma